jgi:hypothetical protein
MCGKLEDTTSSPLTSSAADFHVRISATPERALAWTARALAYGSSTSESFASFNPDLSSWRTSQRSLLEGWTSYSGRWPKAGTMQSGQAYELPTLALHTAASGCSLWPTPDASVVNDGEDLAQWQARREIMKAKGINGNGCGTPLAIASRLWPTPRRVAPGRQHQQKRSRDLALDVKETGSGKLNPAWVCQLMGFPDGWLDVGPPDPTSRKKPGKLLAPSRERTRATSPRGLHLDSEPPNSEPSATPSCPNARK